MENENIKENIMIDEIGYLAKYIDTEFTIIERMKLNKTSLFRIFYALLIYVATMIIFVFIL